MFSTIQKVHFFKKIKRKKLIIDKNDKNEISLLVMRIVVASGNTGATGRA